MNQEQINQLRAEREAARRSNPEYGLTKKCSICKRELPLNKFNKYNLPTTDVTFRNGRQALCKRCNKLMLRRQSKGKCKPKPVTILYDIMKEKGITQIDNSNKDILKIFVERSGGCTATLYKDNGLIYKLAKQKSCKKFFDYLTYKEGENNNHCKYYLKMKENIEDSKK